MKPIRFDERLKRVTEAMGSESLDVLIATRGGSFRYLAGTQVVWRSAVVVPRVGEPVLVTTSWDVERAMSFSWLRHSKTWEMTRAESYVQAIAEVVRDLGAADRVGLEFGTGAAEGAITASEYLDLAKLLAGAEIIDAAPLLDAVMMKKEPEEIELLSRAAEVADIGMLAAFEAAAPGRRDLDVVGVAEAAMRSAGNEFTWSVTGTEVGSGRRQDFLHGVTAMPTTKIMQVGDFVTLDMHPMVDSYLADFCLNLVIGEPNAEQRALARGWTAVFEHFRLGLRPGAVISDLSQQAGEIARGHDIEELLVPWFGHGLGTDARIPKVITANNDSLVEAGDVIVILVQVNRPGIGGMRVELPIVVGANENIPLNSIPVGLYQTTSAGVELVDLNR